MNRTVQIFFFLLASALFPFALKGQLVINEVSQGASGTKEYVELLVTGVPDCSGIPTVDLRGWYIDDNNGAHATGSGTGIATGCIRFTADPLWNAVPIGTLIVIYNDADLNASIPAQDLSLTDGNCRLVVPISNCTLFEKNLSNPVVGNAVYPTTGFTACGNWSTVGMANTDDSFQTVDPLGNIVHAVSWGNNTLSPVIYFAGSSGGMVCWMNNNSNNNPSLQANWVRTVVAGNETPGAPNNAANALWIASMNNNCTPFVPLTATASSTNTCSCTGTATASPAGGIAPYSYSWAPTGGTNATATGLCGGTYTCTVTDAAGCSQVVTATVAAAAPPTAILLSSTDVTCNGGSNGHAVVQASGGSGLYSFSWSPSGGNFASANGLSPGTYTCTITDSYGCFTTQTVTITEPPPLTVTASGPSTVCGNGSISLSANANGNYTSVSWSGGTGTYSPSNALSTTYTPGVGESGTVTATVTVTNSTCNETVTATVTFTVIPVPVAAIAANGPLSFCTGYDVTLTASGGTSYLWSNSSTNPSITVNTAGTYTVTVSNSCGTDTETVAVSVVSLPVAQITAGGPTTFCPGDSVVLTAAGGSSFLWSTSDTTQSITVSTAGTYSCIVTATCGTDTAQITVSTLPLAVAQITASGPTTFCAGGNVTLTASGGSSYLWSNSATSSAITVNTAGTYTVAVTNSCSTDTASITVNILPLPVAQITASGPTTFCSGGNVTLTASGGSSYLWSTNSSAASITVNTAGTYTVAVTNSCGVDTETVVVTVLPLPVVQITASGPTTFCTGGNVTLTASGGSSYVWSNNSNAASITVNAAGTYSVTATNSCGNATGSITVTVLSLPVAQISASGPTTICSGDNLTLTASGGTNYTWSNGDNTAATVVNTAGTYIVTASNICGTDTAAVTVVTLPAPQATISGNTTICAGDQAVLSASGTGNFLWSNGSGSNSISVSTAGTYYLVASNSCGSDTAFVNVSVDQVTAQFTTDVNTGLVPLPVNFTDNSSSNAVSWQWNFGDNSSSNLSDPSHIYTSGGTFVVVLTVTNANGCSDTAMQVVIAEYEPSYITVPNVFTPNGDGINDGFFTANLSIEKFSLEIYDRWGVLIFESNDPAAYWNGKNQNGNDVSDGTYYYVISANGFDKKVYELKGFITLIR